MNQRKVIQEAIPKEREEVSQKNRLALFWKFLVSVLRSAIRVSLVAGTGMVSGSSSLNTQSNTF